MTAVVLLLAQGVVINRAAGVAYPLWSPRPALSPDSAAERAP